MIAPDELGDRLARLTDRYDVPGASVALVADGRLVEAATGTADTRTGLAVTPETVFPIQSVTKMWTATLAMQLVDEGLVALDAPVSSYLPGFRAGVTVRHLLTHTGGFEGDLWAPTTTGDDALERFVADLVSTAPQYADPGTLYSYCSAGYGVLGRLVERARGSTYETALRRHLADPLGVQEIAFDTGQTRGLSTAIGHTAREEGGPQQPLDAWAVMPPSNPAAGNQLAMSARGLLALGRLHLADGLAPDGTRVLSGASARAMRERQVDHPFTTSGSGQGLGWFVSGTPAVVEHGGGAIGVSSMLRVVPEDGTAVAVLTNGEHGGALIRALLDPDREIVPPPARRVREPDRFVGRYENRVSRHDVTIDEGRLRLETTELHEALDLVAAAGLVSTPTVAELRPLGADRFAVVDDSGDLRSTLAFLGADGDGRAVFLHTGRAAPRVA